MKLRHAAALVGWYLMVPPQGNTKVCDGSAPISSRWAIIGSFDKADDCENAHARLVQKEKTERSKRCVIAALCIATDDPRLKEK